MPIPYKVRLKKDGCTYHNHTKGSIYEARRVLVNGSYRVLVTNDYGASCTFSEYFFNSNFEIYKEEKEMPIKIELTTKKTAYSEACSRGITLEEFVTQEYARQQKEKRIIGIKDFVSAFPDVEKVVINDITTVVWLKNGNVGKATCDAFDTFDVEVGFAVAYMKAKFGGKKNYVRLMSFLAKKVVWEKNPKVKTHKGEK